MVEQEIFNIDNFRKNCRYAFYFTVLLIIILAVNMTIPNFPFEPTPALFLALLLVFFGINGAKLVLQTLCDRKYKADICPFIFGKEAYLSKETLISHRSIINIYLLGWPSSLTEHNPKRCLIKTKLLGHYVYIFSLSDLIALTTGTMLHFRIKEKFSETIVIRPDTSLPGSYTIGSAPYKVDNLSIVKVVAPFLDKKAHIYSDDQIASRKRLNPSTLAKLEDLYHEDTVGVLLFDQDVYVWFPQYEVNTCWTDNPFLETKLSTRSRVEISIKEVKQMINITERVLSILKISKA